jgi:hypothetical protein
LVNSILEAGKMYDEVEMLANEKTPLTSGIVKSEKEKIVLDLLERFQMEEKKLKRKYIVSSICQLSVSVVLFLIIILVLISVLQLPISGKNFKFHTSNGGRHDLHSF